MNSLYQQFKERYPTMMQDVRCGFYLPEGWVGLVTELCDKLVAMGFEGQVDQVKEKFGGLRFYVSGGTEEQRKLIYATEDASFNYCEKCGSQQDVTTKSRSGWIRTRCAMHDSVEGNE